MSGRIIFLKACIYVMAFSIGNTKLLGNLAGCCIVILVLCVTYTMYYIAQSLRLLISLFSACEYCMILMRHIVFVLLFTGMSLHSAFIGILMCLAIASKGCTFM